MENLRCDVLLVENGREDQSAFKQFVLDRHFHFNIVVVCSIRQVRQLLFSRHFDIIFTEYQLEDGTGFEIIRLAGGIPVIFTTAAGNEETAVRALKAGAFDYLIKDKERNYLAMIPVLIRNSLEKKKMADRVRKLTSAVEQSPGMVVITNIEGNIEYVNPKFSRVTGYELSEIEGRNPRILKSGFQSHEVYENMWNVIRQGGEWMGEFRNRRKDGSVYWESASVSAIRDAAGTVTHYIKVAEDITDRKKMEEELREAVRIKSKFISMVSHELRTPLTAIKEGISLVLEEVTGPVNDDQKDFLDTAKRNVDRLHRLINNVLDFSKLESGQVEYRMEANDLNLVINQVIETFQAMLKEKNLYIRAELQKNLPPVFFDADRITQTLTNIINNSSKFTEQGGIKVRSMLSSSGDSVRVCVEDTGVGIKKEDMPGLFQTFHQVGDKKYRKPGSSGLGLAISREIISAHGGQIWVESVPDQGACFFFTLPCIKKQNGEGELKNV